MLALTQGALWEGMQVASTSQVAPADSRRGKWGPQLHSHKELSSTNNLNGVGSGFIPRVWSLDSY